MTGSGRYAEYGAALPPLMAYQRFSLKRDILSLAETGKGSNTFSEVSLTCEPLSPPLVSERLDDKRGLEESLRERYAPISATFISY